MKKIYYVLILFLAAVLFTSQAQAQTVDNFDDFNAALALSTASYSLTLSSDIVITGVLNSVTPDSIEIGGNGFSLDGNEQNTNFVTRSGKVLSFSDIDLTNFSLSSSSDSFGGLINNEGVLNITGSSVSYNSVKNNSEDDGSKAYGGALYNSGTANIYNSSFMYNSASSNASSGTAAGGAIFNEGTLNIIADGANVEFTGNTSGGKSNAAHNAESAEMNLNANTADSIVFNDAVTGDGGIININKTGDWDSVSNPAAPDGNKIPLSAPITGAIVFNNSVTGNDINLYGGTLKLGIFDGIQDSDDKYIVAASKGSIGSSASRNNFTMYNGSTLDMANGNVGDVVYASTFTVLSGTANVKMDVDLQKRSSDKINVSQETLGSGKLSFYGMNIIGDFQVGISTDISVFTDTTTMTTNYLDGVNFVTYGSSGVYRITQGADNLSLNFLLTEYTDDPFQHAVSTQTGERSYNLDTDYNVPANFDSLLSTGTLYVIGNGKSTIYGNQVSNIFNVADSNTVLDLKDLTIKDAQAEEGGAIYNSGTVSVSGVVFDVNIASSSGVSAKGGAIYNENLLNIYDSSFTGNIAVGSGAVGGAIYSDGGILNIVAKSANVGFKDNLADGKSNAIHAANGVKLNLNALGGKSIYFYDAITSEGNNNILNINAVTAEEASSLVDSGSNGTVYLDADMSKFGDIDSASGNTVNLYDGTIRFGKNTVFFEDITFNMYEGSRLNMTNGKVDNISIQNFNLPDSGSVYVNLDVDLRNEKADNFIGSTLNNNSGEIVIDEIVLLNDLKNLETKVSIEIADDPDFINALRLSGKSEEILGPVFTYFAKYNNGSLALEHAFDFNPSVFIAPITMQTGGYLGQLNSYDQAFSIIDKALSAEGAKGLWVRPYAYNEDIELNKRLTVTNTAYGAYAGYNSAHASVGRRTTGVFSLYGAYNASDQSYDGATITQGGGLLGATAVLFRGNFYTAFTANLGVVSEHGKGKYGKDNFMMYTKGIAAKSGYNFAIGTDEKFTLQPSLNLSYSIIEVSSYRNTAGVKVDVDRFNPVNIEPAIKLSADFEEDLVSFINISGVWSLLNETKGRVDDIKLPEMSVDPYVQYGIGFEKTFTETFTAGAELYGRSLGRAGVGGQLSFRWSF